MYESTDLEVTFHVMGTVIREDPALAADPTQTQPQMSSHCAERMRTRAKRNSTVAYDPSSTEGVPEAGTARLQQNRSGLFTSDLSVNEFLLVRQAGFQPLAWYRLSRSTTSASSRPSGSRVRR